MSFALAFWILMLFWLLWQLPANALATRFVYGSNLLLFVLFFLLGWHVFGSPLHG